MRIISLSVVSVLIICLFSVSAFAAVLQEYPDLTPEELASFSPGSEYIASTATDSEIVAVYDGETGEFILSFEKNGISDPAALSRIAVEKAIELEKPQTAIRIERISR
ncbi:MAG: hypothetical protein LBU86_06560 [Oscillospiraceae bacterium]|jgi:predicted metal-dependent enzyme (double-stranded beta helix superfamily)|nr:hypothetical protein [Oscillospiraceae bacterium]